VKYLRHDAITGSQAGSLLYGRHEAVTALAPQIAEEAHVALKAEAAHKMLVAQQGASMTPQQLAAADQRTSELHTESMRSVALLAALKDAQGGASNLISGKVAAQLAQNVEMPDGSKIALGQVIEDSRQDPTLGYFRREYTYAQAATGGVPPVPGGPGGGPPQPGSP
jgi:hypothetical protein